MLARGGRGERPVAEIELLVGVVLITSSNQVFLDFHQQEDCHRDRHDLDPVHEYKLTTAKQGLHDG